MNKTSLKVLALTVPLVFSLSQGLPHARAVEANEPSVETLLISPRFDYLSQITCGLTISGWGRANCEGSFTTHDQYDSRMTLLLQQFKNGSWEDVKSWSEDYTGSGVNAFSKGYYVDSGYRYRVTNTVEILNGNGDVIETEVCNSPIKEY